MIAAAIGPVPEKAPSKSDVPCFEVPVAIVSKPGHDPYVAKCMGYKASCTSSAMEAMRAAAAKAINASGRLAADVRALPSEITLHGKAGAFTARYALGGGK